MPCSDGGYTAEQERQMRADAARKEQMRKDYLDKLTRMLCTLGNAVLDCNYDFEDDIGIEREEALEIEDWIHEHNTRDEERLKKEAAAAKAKAKAEADKKKREKLAASAKKKLTKAERDALGLK